MKKGKDLYIELMATWEDLESDMGEMAAFSVACEQMNLDGQTAYDLIATYGDGEGR